MKIVEAQNLVKVEGNVEVQKFGFVFNAHMVKLLSDSLYNDKILAIVRELSTNALDSHRENGNADKPFDVHLPSWNELYFSIRDYGTGMSEERVDNIYRNYGGSDRNDSNDYTGGMGLGSKTPFCYNTKSFTIDVWYDNVHTCYSAYVGEDGIPCIAKMSEEPSNDPSGVKISIPVKRYDESNFQLAAEKIYKYFDVKPNITGHECNIKTLSYVVCGNNNEWRLRDNDGGGCRVVMGNVAYPVSFDDANMTQAQKNVLNSPFDIYAEIGSLSVGIGRESLSYDNRTKTHIRNHINSIVNEFNAKIQSEIDKCVNLWEARKKCVELVDATKIKVADPLKLTYKGKKLFTIQNVVDFEQLIDDDKVQITSIYRFAGYSKFEKKKVNALNVKSDYVFYENDLTTGSFVRAYAIYNRTNKKVVLFKFKDAAAKAEVIAHLGCDDTYFTKISTEPSPTVRTYGGRRGNIGRVVSFQYQNYGHSSKSYYWTSESDVDFDKDGGVYVEFNRFRFKNNKGNFPDPKVLNDLIRLSQNIGITIPTVYGIKTADIHRIKKNHKWINFYDWIESEVNKVLPKFNTNEISFYQDELEKIGIGGRYGHVVLGAQEVLNISSNLTKESLFSQFADNIKTAKTYAKNYSKIVSLIDLCSSLEIKITDDFVKPKDFSLDKMQKEVYTKYGMLNLLNSYEIEKNILRIARYIDAVS